MRKNLTIAFTALLICCGLLSAARAQRGVELGNDLLRPDVFLQIPGPNPILSAGQPGVWDDAFIEAADCFEDLGTYYLYYHGHSRNKEGYQLGVASSSHPLGPFARHGDRPIVPKGPAGSWDDANTFCSLIVKVTTGGETTGVKYYMFYGGSTRGSDDTTPTYCNIGLATADHPLGPWAKHAGNPILEDFGYNGGIVEKNGKWYLFNAWPISSTGGHDYSPMAVATADKPEGPWTKYEGNPILSPGGWGEWDDGGFSEAKVFVVGDMFHMFYGGAKAAWPRFETRESIGYAYSRDGFHWTKYGRNPVANRRAEFNAAAYAEVRGLWESPFVYCYHTLRYEKPWRERDKDFHPDVEDIGVQVLVTQRPFALDMPVLRRASLSAGELTTLSLEETRCIALSGTTSASLTVSCRFHDAAAKSLRIHVRSSTDGEHFDTVDLQSVDVQAIPGNVTRQTFPVTTGGRYLKVIVENLDAEHAVSDVAVDATLRG